MQQAVSTLKFRHAKSRGRNITIGHQDVGSILNHIADLEARVKALEMENTNLSLMGESLITLQDFRSYRKDRVI